MAEVVFRNKIVDDGVAILGIEGTYEGETLVIPESLPIERGGVVVNLPVVSVDIDSFANCRAVASFVLLSSVAKVAFHDAFHDSNLKEFIVSDQNAFFCTKDGVLFSKDGKKLIAYPPCKKDESYRAPADVNEIGAFAFSHAKYLKEVKFSDEKNDESFLLGFRAFFSCTALESIELPNNLTKIGESAFENCFSLAELTLPTELREIGFNAFYECKQLKSVVFNDKLRVVGKLAFKRCKALASIRINGVVETIGNSAFEECDSLSSVDIGNNPSGECDDIIETSIGFCAFYECSALTQVTLRPSIRIIECNAFGRCEKLEELVLPRGVKKVGETFVKTCSPSLVVTLPNGETILGKAIPYPGYLFDENGGILGQNRDSVDPSLT